MIATHCKDCGSKVCHHMVSHEERPDCRGENGWCRHSPECRCVPETHREQLAALMMDDQWGHMTDATAIDKIMEIFGEEGR